MKQKPFKSAKEITEKLNDRGDYGYSSDPLQLRILGFIAEQLEMLNKPKKARRISTPWSKFFSSQLKAGKSAKEAGAAWKLKKSKGVSK